MGGMAMNKVMVQAMEEMLNENKKEVEILTHPDAIYSGATGAALWGGFRYNKLKIKEELSVQ